MFGVVEHDDEKLDPLRPPLILLHHPPQAPVDATEDPQELPPPQPESGAARAAPPDPRGARLSNLARATGPDYVARIPI